MIDLHLQMLNNWDGSAIPETLLMRLQRRRADHAQAATICEVSGQTICRWSDDAATKANHLACCGYVVDQHCAAASTTSKNTRGVASAVKAENLLKKHCRFGGADQSVNSVGHP